MRVVGEHHFGVAYTKAYAEYVLPYNLRKRFLSDDFKKIIIRVEPCMKAPLKIQIFFCVFRVFFNSFF